MGWSKRASNEPSNLHWQPAVPPGTCLTAGSTTVVVGGSLAWTAHSREFGFFHGFYIFFQHPSRPSGSRYNRHGQLCFLLLRPFAGSPRLPGKSFPALVWLHVPSLATL